MSELLEETYTWYILHVLNPHNKERKKFNYSVLERAEANFKKWASIQAYEVSLEKRVVIDTQIKVKYPNQRLK